MPSSNDPLRTGSPGKDPVYSDERLLWVEIVHHASQTMPYRIKVFYS
jgi:hypothetical protein